MLGSPCILTYFWTTFVYSCLTRVHCMVYATMRRRDVTLVIVTALMTSCGRVTSGRALPDPVHYDMDEKLPVGTAVGQGMVVDANLAAIYSTSELSQLQFSLVRGLPPDLTSQYFTIDQHPGLVQVDSH